MRKPHHHESTHKTGHGDSAAHKPGEKSAAAKPESEKQDGEKTADANKPDGKQKAPPAFRQRSSGEIASNGMKRGFVEAARGTHEAFGSAKTLATGNLQEMDPNDIANGMTESGRAIGVGVMAAREVVGGLMEAGRGMLFRGGRDRIGDFAEQGGKEAYEKAQQALKEQQKQLARSSGAGR